MGIKDLMVEAPPGRPTTPPAAPPNPASPTATAWCSPARRRRPAFDKRVSVSVDLSITGADRTTLVFTATGILTGPGTADQAVPDDKKAAVLDAFSTSLPGQKLPFGVAPTSQGARGSDVIIEGITEGVTITPRRVQTVMSSSLGIVIAVAGRA